MRNCCRTVFFCHKSKKIITKIPMSKDRKIRPGRPAESSPIRADNGAPAPSRSVALLGLKHSGKSSVAELLSHRLDIPHVDTDRLICAKSGCVSAREAYRELGKDGFRELEYSVCSDLARRAGAEKMVIATGGGIADNEKALETLSAAADFIYLFESEEILYKRFMEGGRPAFLPEEGAKEAWSRIYSRRDRICRRRASLVIDCRSRSLTEVAESAYEFVMSA